MGELASTGAGTKELVEHRGIVAPTGDGDRPASRSAYQSARMLIGTGRLVRAFVVYGLLTEPVIEVVGFDVDV